MHGGQVDEGYCIVDSDTLEESMTSGSTSRKQIMVEEYFKEVKQVTELDDGYSFQFPSKSQSIEKLVQLITKERKSNPSVEFDIIFQQNEEPLLLQIKGNSAKDFVKSFVPSSVFNSQMENKNLDS
jgi:hypothetical protein